jgi:AraC-like DNA-binding protein
MLPLDRFNEKAFDYYASLKKIRTHVENNYSQPISLSAAAELVGLEATHFSKVFRRTVGIGFKRWLTRLRVHKAMECIERGDESLTDIAFKVGFQDLKPKHCRRLGLAVALTR